METAGACCRTCGLLPVVTSDRASAGLFPSSATCARDQGAAGASMKVVTGSGWLSLENMHLEKGSRRVG